MESESGVTSAFSSRISKSQAAFAKQNGISLYLNRYVYEQIGCQSFARQSGDYEILIYIGAAWYKARFCGVGGVSYVIENATRQPRRPSRGTYLGLCVLDDRPLVAVTAGVQQIVSLITSTVVMVNPVRCVVALQACPKCLMVSMHQVTRNNTIPISDRRWRYLNKPPRNCNSRSVELCESSIATLGELVSLWADEQTASAFKSWHPHPINIGDVVNYGQAITLGTRCEKTALPISRRRTGKVSESLPESTMMRVRLRPEITSRQRWSQSLTKQCPPDAGFQISDENLVDMKYAGIVPVFEEGEKAQMFSNELTKVIPSLGDIAYNYEYERPSLAIGSGCHVYAGIHYRHHTDMGLAVTISSQVLTVLRIELCSEPAGTLLQDTICGTAPSDRGNAIFLSLILSLSLPRKRSLQTHTPKVYGFTEQWIDTQDRSFPPDIPGRFCSCRSAAVVRLKAQVKKGAALLFKVSARGSMLASARTRVNKCLIVF
ncbi:hypothetical protein CLF_101997 [Clonorchis sinensis]|uniref:Uncharacterized protein n=1 Tax=Clonorchis sinensis TaxID=79923 RepID=G7Y722_CLOSI|nr:hypothetical protein CLF_101997 [Clonorchis sinensis]